jgi:opacity protein-like surface antigen
MRQFRQFAKYCGGGLLILLLAAAAPAQTPPQVRVKDPAAVIRMAPEASAPVILGPLTPGNVYPVERRMGDWYEIKFVSSAGVRLTGYVHRLHVDEVAAEAPAAEREAAGEEGGGFVSPLRSGLEFAATGGMGFNRFTGGSSQYGRSLESFLDLQALAEAGTIYFTLGNPTALAASCSVFFTPGLGLRLQIDRPLTQSFTEGFSNYTISWAMAGADSASRMKTFAATGSYAVTPISLNAIARLALGSVVTAFLTGGPTYFTGTFSADSSIGYARTWFDTAQHVDFFTVPAKTEQTFKGWGFNVGTGLEIWVNRRIAILLEGDYLGGPSASQKWVVQSGTYTSNITAGTNWTNAALPAELADYISPLTIRLSYFKIVTGVKIHI